MGEIKEYDEIYKKTDFHFRNLKVVKFKDIFEDINWTNEEFEKDILKDIIFAIETTANKEIANDKVVVLPYIGKITRNTPVIKAKSDMLATFRNKEIEVTLKHELMRKKVLKNIKERNDKLVADHKRKMWIKFHREKYDRIYRTQGKIYADWYSHLMVNFKEVEYVDEEIKQEQNEIDVRENNNCRRYRFTQSSICKTTSR
ncbi:hypothetical protein [Thomasclavelia cocleata]|uniref:hypothetical protein n=1 Tax=Thomasclavelia cocleata TaxID=69824 RepID=UPI00258C199A|nr:hypothetical protein [Thomasclavelia cocleata]